MHGIVDEKTDVFAFGVLLLELISGRRALDYSQQSLVLWVCFPVSLNLVKHLFQKFILINEKRIMFGLLKQAKPLLRKNLVRELVDPAIAENCDKRQLHLTVLAASLCIQQSSIRRPDMNQVCYYSSVFNK